MSLPPDPEYNRTRYVGYRWVRNPHGKLLPMSPPIGMRTPNDIKWAHSLSDIYWIAMDPDIPNAVSMWTRSMNKEFGDDYDESEYPEPEPAPRVKHPWPVLVRFASLREIKDAGLIASKIMLNGIDDDELKMVQHIEARKLCDEMGVIKILAPDVVEDVKTGVVNDSVVEEYNKDMGMPKR